MKPKIPTQRADASFEYMADACPEVFASQGRRRFRSALLLLGGVVLLAVAIVRLDISPLRIWNGLGMILWLPTQMFLPPVVGENWGFNEGGWLLGAAETLAMAFLGTLGAFLFSFPLAFLAARNVMRIWIVRMGIRRVLDVIRGVDVVIWALIFVNVVGLGAFAGILAIIASNTGELTKLFSEAVENAEKEAMEGVRASGAAEVVVTRWGLLPQVMPIFLAMTLYYFESNTRSSTILGFLGAGGMGHLIYDRIKVQRWGEVGALLIVMLVLVAVIDTMSRVLRNRLVGDQSNKPLEAN